MRLIDGILPAMLLAVAGCAGHPPPSVPAAAVERPAAWRATIRPDDAARIESLRARWTAARAVTARRGSAMVSGDENLLKSDQGLAHGALPPGSYRCRSLVLTRGAMQRNQSSFCYVGGEAGERVSFTKQTGTSLPGGWLYPDGDRYVFLGARQRRPGDGSLGYGIDRTRDLVGVVERIGAFRWRLVLAGDPIEIYELVPAERQGVGAG
jgi:hypothetical protein